MNRLLVLGTHNRKKGEELTRLFQPIGVQVLTLADYFRALEVSEDGSTFGENARLKACRQAAHLGAWVLGEDSGLQVDALDGRPGIFSARFAGLSATDAANNARLLRELDGIPAERRSAQYVCHMTLADATGTVRAESEDRCRGRIAPAPRGTGGFGYDPLFEIVEYHRTFGELGDAVKSLLSHRGRAARRMLGQLTQLARQEAWT